MTSHPNLAVGTQLPSSQPLVLSTSTSQTVTPALPSTQSSTTAAATTSNVDQEAAAERVRKILEAPRPYRPGLPKVTNSSRITRSRAHSGRVFRKEVLERLDPPSAKGGGGEYIQDKAKRLASYNTRKTQLLKKAHELSVCTGADVLVLVASDSGSAYTFASPRLKRFLSDSKVVARLKEALSQDDVDDEDSDPNDSDDDLRLDDEDDDDDDVPSHLGHSTGSYLNYGLPTAKTLLPASLSHLRTQPPAKMPKLNTSASVPPALSIAPNDVFGATPDTGLGAGPSHDGLVNASWR
eukprot:m.216671 g.216671  ORF g.216671 m.216671 type:complete len:295 (-) comp17202_c0_seq13:158-1042(-)